VARLTRISVGFFSLMKVISLSQIATAHSDTRSKHGVGTFCTF
jgi:hypothetical protein